MKKLRVLFIAFLLVIPVFCGYVKDATAGTNYRPIADNVLTENRVAFDPVLVEDTIQTSFYDPVLYDITKAAATYDYISDQNNGFMSIEELFAVCLNAHKDKDLISVSPLQVWSICKDIFILPLLTQAEEEAFIDNEIDDIYNGHIFDQGCTPPETDVTGEVKNMVCTSGEYANIDPAFEKAMITKFRTEGGCTDVQKDGCHRTCYGVCSGNINKHTHKYEVYNEKLEKDWQNKTHTFTRKDAEDVAYKKYYTKYNYNLLPDAIRGDLFMARWGRNNDDLSTDLLQRILGVPVTHKIDAATISAAENYPGNLRKKFLKARWRGLKQIAQEKVANGGTDFSNGWAKAFIVYLRNGCHTIPKKPLYRDKATTSICPK